MKHMKNVTMVDVKSLLSLFVIVPMLALTLSACKQESDQNELSMSDDTLSAPIPSALLAVTSSNLVVGISVDGGLPQTCTNLSVNQSSGTYSCKFPLLQGSHFISITYSINDSSRGLVQVASSSGINVNILPGQVTPANFSSGTLNYTHSDIDGIRNLDELDNGTNPFDSNDPGDTELRFSVGGTVSGLTGLVTLQLTGGVSTSQTVSNNGSFTLSSNMTSNSSYSVTISSQPSGQICTVSNGSGSISGANVTNVAVSCINEPRVLNFRDSGQTFESNFSHTVTLGDVDGDGDLDMLVSVQAATSSVDGLFYDGGLKIYTNNGNGIFTDTEQFLNSTPGRSTLSDIDGDGDLDIVAIGSNNDGTTRGILTYTNNGSGVFIDTGRFVDADFPNHFVLGDINGDGDMDIVLSNHNFPGNAVYTNNGSGVFTNTEQSLEASNSRAVALGDIDGDGDLDIVSTNSSVGNFVFTNNGNGVFTDTGQSLGSYSTYSVALGDIDGDGDLDMIEANAFGDVSRIYNNNGSGVFTDSGQFLATSGTTDVALGDIDEDGDLDIVFSSIVGTLSGLIYINNGAGVFTDTGQSFGSFNSQSVALGDIDGDGDLDAVVANSSLQSDRVFLND